MTKLVQENHLTQQQVGRFDAAEKVLPSETFKKYISKDVSNRYMENSKKQKMDFQ